MKKNKIHIAYGLLIVVAFFYFNVIKNSENTNYEEYPVWIEMMESPNINIREARKAFDTYWEHNKHYKGDRSKQFERWYIINSKRLDEYGNVISAKQVRNEFVKIRSKLAFNQLGQWFNYGPINVGPRNNGIKKDGTCKRYCFPYNQCRYLLCFYV
jgi:hypothetical protein